MIVARRPPEMTGQPRPRCGVGTASPMIVLRLRSSEVLAPQLATGSSGEAEGWHRPAPEVAQSSTEEYTRGFGYFTEERA
jgi:hypothetical protein